VSRTTEEWDHLKRTRSDAGLPAPECENCICGCGDRRPGKSCTGWWGSPEMGTNIECNTYSLFPAVSDPDQLNVGMVLEDCAEQGRSR
jgi:hypothetical protein